MAATGIAGRDLPPPQSPFVDKDTRNLSYDGYQFLLSLLNAATNSIPTASVGDGLTATGTNQATALQLSSQWNEVDTTPVGTGVLLSGYQPGQAQVVLNAGVNPLKVYPPPGMQINALGVNAPFALGAGLRQTFDFFTSGIRT